MDIKDVSPAYYNKYWIPNWRDYRAILGVGWLGRDDEFPRGPVSQLFVRRLWEGCIRPTIGLKQCHRCPRCGGTSVTLEDRASAHLG